MLGRCKWCQTLSFIDFLIYVIKYSGLKISRFKPPKSTQSNYCPLSCHQYTLVPHWLLEEKSFYCINFPLQIGFSFCATITFHILPYSSRVKCITPVAVRCMTHPSGFLVYSFKLCSLGYQF